MPGKPFKPSPLLLVMATVVLQLAAAWILGTVASASPHPGWALAGLAVAAAIGLSFFRFIIWGHAHRLYPLSHTYPLTALFFPCILVLSYFKGDAVSLVQIVGTILITLGAFTLSSSEKKKEATHG